MLAADQVSKSEQEAILAQLQKILASDYFRNSQRCSRFLEYSVRYLVHHEPGDDLKERRVGIDVFHRALDYDTARDNIVRVTANEVRKRLAQYYASVPAGNELLLEMPAGKYAVSVRPFSSEPKPLDKPPLLDPTAEKGEPLLIRRPTPWFRWAVVTACLLGIAGTILYRVEESKNALAAVWQPLLKNPSPVLISVAEPVAYEPASGSTVAARLDEPMVPLRDAFVGVGDTFALADIAQYLTGIGKNWRLVAGNDLPSQELRTGPIVFVGAHSNLWTARMMAGLRYTFGMNNSVLDGGKVNPVWSLPGLRPDWQTPEDYAIVSRFRSPQTGQPIIIVAGLTNSGTQVAGEFMTSSELLRDALKQAPKGWESGNFQFVLHTKLIGRTPERPTVVASYFW
jgi:hypothetical protein